MKAVLEWSSGGALIILAVLMLLPLVLNLDVSAELAGAECYPFD
jgi:hypothetical protein